MGQIDDLKLVAPKEIIDLAVTLGSDFRITQGPGGNVSMKENGILWVKASGTHMAQAKLQTIFVPVDLKDAQKRMSDGSVSFTNLQNGSSLRPSIETSMHALIGARFVAHVHSLGSLSMGMLKDLDTARRSARGVCEVTIIPYVKPGIDLAKCIERNLDNKSSALLLGNHGLTVWGESAQECEDLITQLEEAWRMLVQPVTNNRNTEWIDIIFGGMLFPDELVFLGPESFSLNPLAQDIFGLLNDNGRQILQESPWISDFLKVLEQVARSGSTIEQARYLTNLECNELLNWDAEKFRKKQIE
jgi:ribulose-5-phosphate 4-epimerase/fuculose-1-phosphate aldolase